VLAVLGKNLDTRNGTILWIGESWRHAGTDCSHGMPVDAYRRCCMALKAVAACVDGHSIKGRAREEQCLSRFPKPGYTTACRRRGKAEGVHRMIRKTLVSVQGDDFYINDRPTYAGRTYNGWRIEGLLFNSRMVQGIFDDLNLATRTLWAYPDGPWDPERNTRAFVAAMPGGRAHGLLSFTLNLHGGCCPPRGYCAWTGQLA